MSYFFGILLSLVAVYVTIILLGSSPAEYWDLHAFIIVVGGSIFASGAGGNMIDMVKMPIYMIKAMVPIALKPASVVVDMKRMADKVRQGGLPALTSEIPTAPDEFSRRGIKMLSSGTESKVVHEVMEADIHAMELRHSEIYMFMEAVGGNAPTFGLIGTVMGTIEALGALDNIAALGHALAVALTATFYGVFTANVIWMPLSQQLKLKSHREAFVRKMYMEGLLAIQAGFTSEVVSNLMKSYVNQATRAKIEGGKVGGKKVERHIEYTTYMAPLEQEKALAFMAEVKKETDAKNLGQDDVKSMLADLINEATDKVLMKDFANEFLKIKTVKKLPAGSKRKGKKKKK